MTKKKKTANPPDPNRRTARLVEAAKLALHALPIEDLVDRIDYCRVHNLHGMVVWPIEEPPGIEVHWGGRLLAVVPLELLDSDEPIQAPDMVNGHVPDVIPPEWMTIADDPDTASG